MPNGSKQYQQTESDCLRNSDGDAFGRNIAMPASPPARKSDPQRDFRQQGLSPGWFGAIRRDSMIRRYSMIREHRGILKAQCDPGARCGPAGFGPAAGTARFGRPCREQCGTQRHSSSPRVERKLPAHSAFPAIRLHTACAIGRSACRAVQAGRTAGQLTVVPHDNGDCKRPTASG